MVMSPQLVWMVARAGALVSAGLSRRPSGFALGLGTDLQPVGTAAPPGGGRSVVEVFDGLLEPQPARASRARMVARARKAAEHTASTFGLDAPHRPAREPLRRRKPAPRA